MNFMSLTILLKGGPQMMVTLLWVTGHHLIPIRLVKSMGADAAICHIKLHVFHGAQNF